MSNNNISFIPKESTIKIDRTKYIDEINDTLKRTSQYWNHIKVDISPLGGLGVFAQKSFEFGNVIADGGIPYAVVPEPLVENVVCSYCCSAGDTVETKELPQCPECKSVHYCNKNCKEYHKPIHKHECAMFKALKSRVNKKPSKSVVLLARMLIKRYAESVGEIFDFKSMNLVDYLSNHADDFKGKDKDDRMSLALMTAIFLEKKPPQMIDTQSVQILYKYLCTINCNGFSIFNTRTEQLATGLYPELSFFNHSCKPNIVAIYSALGSLKFKALRKIEIGEELVFSYVDVTDKYEDREKSLQDTYFFKCSCQACKEIRDNKRMDSYFICESSTCRSRADFFEKKGELKLICLKCGKDHPAKIYYLEEKNLEESFKSVMDSVNTGKNINVTHLSQLFARVEKYMHPGHIRMRVYLEDIYRLPSFLIKGSGKEYLELMVKIAKRDIDYLTYHYGPTHPNTDASRARYLNMINSPDGNEIMRCFESFKNFYDLKLD